MSIKKNILVLLLLITAFNANAKLYNKITRVLQGPVLLAIQNGSSMVFPAAMPGILSSNLNRLNTTDTITTYQNTVELVVNNHSALSVNAKVTVTADLTIYLIDNSAPVVKTITLEDSFKAGQTGINQAKQSDIANIYAFKNAYRVDVKITNVVIWSDSHMNSTLLKDLLGNFIELNVSFQEDRITRIDYNKSAENLISCEDRATDELVISWDPMPNAESYELEYTFVDNYGPTYTPIRSPNTIQFNFKNNSTRLSLIDPYYRLPLLFERGYVLYRVRAIGRGGGLLQDPVYCKWSGNNVNSGTVDNFNDKYFHNGAHMADLMNWQVATTFAEEGKRSDVVKYMDGTFRTRQTVTGMNLDPQLPVKPDLQAGNSQTPSCFIPGRDKIREVIAGEIVYDFQGRPAVNILPVPTDSKIIQFLPNLNISKATSAPYAWPDFDIPNYQCQPNTKELSDDLVGGIMGAAAYYSPKNPTQLGFNAFIPKAEGFPFTLINYLQDNTGRVGAQTGVGKMFQFQQTSSQRHFTRFFYAAPNQEELDMMFGTEAGDAVRYKKNAVIDANGQVSVTYINPEGKTIATALAGANPGNLDALPNQGNNTIDISLLDKNHANTDDRTLTCEHEFVVTSDQTKYTFDYTITPEKLTAAICNGDSVCLDCIYDIKITLTNEESCDNSILLVNDSGTIGQLLNKQGEVDLQCDSNSGMPGQINNSSGNIGKNQNPQLKNSPHNTGVPNNQGQNGQFGSNSPNNANTHLNANGVDRWHIVKMLDIGTYIITKKITVNKKAAEAYVDKVFKDTCMAEWDTLLAHELKGVDTMACYSTCTKCGQPPVQTKYCDTDYCKPNPNRCDVIYSMMLADVSPGGQYAQFVRDGNGTINANVYPVSVFNVFGKLSNSPINFPSLFPSSITNSQQLIDNWLPEYADKLLPMHPENCKYGWCKVSDNYNAMNFDVQILSTQLYADAVKNSYLTTGFGLPPYEQLLNKDPWFSNSANAGIKSQLLSKLQNYACSGPAVSIDVLAMQMAWCAAHNPPPGAPGGTPSMNTNATCNLPPTYLSQHAFGSDNTVYGNLGRLADLEWTYLRALYLSAKNNFVQSSINDFASTSCNVQCIGAQDYFDWRFLFGASIKPCNYPNWYLYSDKQSRFSTGIDNILSVIADNGIPVNVSSVNDLNDPCKFAAAIAGQSGSINQEVANTLCGDTTVPCPVADSLVALLNKMITALSTNSTVSWNMAQLPSWVTNAGVIFINGSHSTATTLEVAFRTCGDITIPYLHTQSGYAAPISVCCISNINCPANANCNFDITVKYPENVSNVMHINTGCHFLSGCATPAARPCAQVTAYDAIVKGYLNNLFNFIGANGAYPDTGVIKALMPSAFHVNNRELLRSVSFTTAPDFSISLTYPYHYTTGVNGLVQTMQPDPVCKIVVQHNAKITDFTKLRSVISVVPDYSAAVGGITNHFLAKVLYQSGANTFDTTTIKGYATCLPMNQCPACNSCDSIKMLPPYPYENNCVDGLIARAHENANIKYNAWADSMKSDLLQRYYANCMKAMEALNMKYNDLQYQYTLYYYDQAGNLVKTVPPAGVKLFTHADEQNVANSRANGYNVVYTPQHIKTTEYRYNTLNQPIWLQSPDAGWSVFVYDQLARIVASQNMQQKVDGTFSYTKYDLLGRMEESGKLQAGYGMMATEAGNFATWRNFIDGNTTRTEITKTIYDVAHQGVSQKFGAGGQKNLRKRVASILEFADAAAVANKNYTHATHYSYDIEGNVYHLIQDYPNGIIGDKHIEYDYDLQSGKVNYVTYQRGAPDQFIHKYSYDAANRLTMARTSPDGLVWETDATYKYYRHGPLARIELGTDKVQGLDYIYTLQGWIKGVNGTTEKAETDMGQDGIIDPSGQGVQIPVYTSGGVTHYTYNTNLQFGNSFNGPGYGAMHNPFARDAFGYILEYYGTDYTSINGNTCLAGMNNSAGTVKPLYNGNISRMYTQVQALGNNGYNYTYDQLNRITSQHAWNIANNTMAMLGSDVYSGTLTYDADGNIMNQWRNGNNTATPAMDNMTYKYYTLSGATYDPAVNIPAGATNKLATVDDPVPAGNYTNDIDGHNSYTYNAIGNLVSEAENNVTSTIDWNLQEKILNITRSGSPSLKFEYDALGNRVMKEVTAGGNTNDVKTFYVRDAKGTQLASYTYLIPTDGSSTTPQLYWSEADIYGSQRIGLYGPHKAIPVAPNGGNIPGGTWTGGGAGNIGVQANNTGGGVWTSSAIASIGSYAYYTATRGYKQYELANHLGNVLATISDRKIPVSGTGGITYTADLINGQDYYAFGMLMPGRSVTTNGNYRYGFNGKENDNEVKGDGDQQDYGFRIYDPRLAKFLSVDPLTAKYPELTPYQFASNKPINGIDEDGKEWAMPDPSTEGPVKRLLYQELDYGDIINYAGGMGGNAMTFLYNGIIAGPVNLVYNSSASTISSLTRVSTTGANWAVNYSLQNTLKSNYTPINISYSWSLKTTSNWGFAPIIKPYSKDNLTELGKSTLDLALTALPFTKWGKAFGEMTEINTGYAPFDYIANAQAEEWKDNSAKIAVFGFDKNENTSKSEVKPVQAVIPAIKKSPKQSSSKKEPKKESKQNTVSMPFKG